MVLVTGGTGLVGRAVVKELLGHRFKVRCLVRNPERARTLLGPEPEYVAGDVTDPASVQAAMEGVEAVIHLVAIIREKGCQTFRAINVGGTANVVRAAKAAGVRRLIHMSALGVKADPRRPYGYSKWQGEELVRESGLDWTILRPSVVYGPGFGFLDRMAQSVKLSPPPLVFYPAVNILFQPIASWDLARCVRLCLADAKLVKQSCDLGGPEHLTYREMLVAYLEAKRLRRFPVPVPLGIIKAVAPVLEKVLPDPPVTTAELRQLEEDNITDPAVVEKIFGFRPTSFKEGLERFTLP
ncbi:SDR family oxidoreductase [Ammonifex thiophilus]|uniref:Complex I NDUFA9 subunit family protein n=1 Tax=Ammonifex thiophilus TaxID=444093 RepID=A0A3D8P2J9_9THEO|nr:complex I NDUFA9 subunit family protein [Ammonifex thiophilus]RDV82504.1 complex I NDUFA9 subunit family protein [Ammonifex thiophilus]